jgi:hypothetical protein
MYKGDNFNLRKLIETRLDTDTGTKAQPPNEAMLKDGIYLYI